VPAPPLAVNLISAAKRFAARSLDIVFIAKYPSRGVRLTNFLIAWRPIESAPSQRHAVGFEQKQQTNPMSCDS
jgi:hypothetical protein